jgi:ribosome recycling factor
VVEEIKKDARTRMQKSVEALGHELSKVRTGRAHANLLDHIMVPYYGSDTPLNQVASISVADARTLMVSPWEKKIVPDIEKAIMQSDLGLNPVTAGDVIRVPLPALTEERRKEMTKIVRHEAENARIAIRNIRRDANAKDAEFKAEDEIQKLTDQFIEEVDGVLAEKEKDLMEV